MQIISKIIKNYFAVIFFSRIKLLSSWVLTGFKYIVTALFTAIVINWTVEATLLYAKSMCKILEIPTPQDNVLLIVWTILLLALYQVIKPTIIDFFSKIDKVWISYHPSFLLSIILNFSVLSSALYVYNTESILSKIAAEDYNAISISMITILLLIELCAAYRRVSKRHKRRIEVGDEV